MPTRRAGYRKIRTPNGTRYQGPGGRFVPRAEFEGAKRLAKDARGVKKQVERTKRKLRPRRVFDFEYRPNPKTYRYYPEDPGAGFYQKLFITKWDFNEPDSADKASQLLYELIQIDADIKDKLSARLAVHFDDGKTAGNKLGPVKDSRIYLEDLIQRYKGEIVRVLVFIYTRSDLLPILREYKWKLKRGARPKKSKEFKVSKPPKKEKEPGLILKPTAGLLKRIQELGRSVPSAVQSSQTMKRKNTSTTMKRKKKTKR